MPFEISGHSFRLLNFLHHFFNTIEYWISFSTLRRVLLRSVRLPDILFFLMISFTLNRIYILSWMQLSDIPFSEHDDHVLLSNEPFRRNLNIRLPDIPFFSFSRLSRVLVSNESFRSIWNIRLPDIFLDSFTLKRIHTLSTFLGSHLKNKLMNISFETNTSLSSELGHFPFRCIFETNIPAPCTHFSSGLVQTYI